MNPISGHAGPARSGPFSNLSRRAVLAAAGAAAESMARDAKAEGADAQAGSVKPVAVCDCHVHVFDADRFPYARERSYTPGPATLDQLRVFMRLMGSTRVVLVQPSVYGSDNACLLNALRDLGPGVARGIAVIDPQTVTDNDLQAMHEAGVRGVRVNLEVKGEEREVAAAQAIQKAAQRISPLGWALQVYADAQVIGALEDLLKDIPSPLILDHYAGIKAGRGLEQPGMPQILRLMQSGRAYVKMSAPYRASAMASGHGDLAPFARAFAEANPQRILWASDWPHTGSASKRDAGTLDMIEPFRKVDDPRDQGLLREWLPEAALEPLFAGNAARLYRF